MEPKTLEIQKDDEFLSIAILILNYNGIRCLKNFLPKIECFSQRSPVYIIDNASIDNSVEYIKKTHPNVKIISHPKNLGFSEGYNKAVEQISEEILCFLNSDVQITESCLETIVPFFEKDSDLAVLQPKILDYKNKSYFEYAGAAGGFIDNLGYPYCRGRVFYKTQIDRGQYDDTSEIFWASGACLFVRKSAYKEIGGFDKEFFAHMEEIDLCWRLKNKGYKIAYTASLKVYHLGAETLKKESPQKTFLNFRNNLFMLLKNLPDNVLYKVLIARLFLDGCAGVYFLFQHNYKHTWAILRAHFSFYKSFSKNYKKRSEKKLPLYYRHKNIFFQFFIMGRKYFDKFR